MRHPRLVLILSSITVASLSLASPALADCDSFEATSDGSQRNVVFVDADPEGTSVGDRRIGFRQVKSSADESIGEHHWINTVVMVDADGNPTRSLENHVVRLAAGSLFYSVSNEIVSPSSDTEKPSVADHLGAVTGGTGEFDEAAGSVGISFDGNAITYSFMIDCD